MTRTTAEPKQHKDPSHINQIKHLDDPQTSGRIFCALVRQKWTFLEGVGLLTTELRK